jgi:transcription antitermination factor NusG
LRWYALAVRGRCEKGVVVELRRVDVEAYLPMHAERRVWSDRVKIVETALFPGYVFVHADLATRQRFRILDVKDAIAIVSVGSDTHGTAIPDEEIESVRALVERAHLVEPCDLMPVGTPVVVGAGPLKGVHGVVQEFETGKKRIVCAITLLGRAVRAEIDPDLLLPSTSGVCRG